VRARVTVSVRDVIIIFIGLSIPSYYIKLYSRTSTTPSPNSRFPLQDIDNIIWVNVASHTHSRHLRTNGRLNFPSGGRKIYQAHKSTPPANSRHGAPHTSGLIFFSNQILNYCVKKKKRGKYPW